MYQIWLVILLIGKISCTENQIYHVSLNGDNTNIMNWRVDYNYQVVVFEIHIPSKYNWFALGFSDRGDQFPADYCILWTDFNKKTSFQDISTDEHGITTLDKQQDCKGFKMHKRKGVIKYTYYREFDTCDSDDYIIEDGTTHVVWIGGTKPLYKVNGLNISSPTDEHGMVRVKLLKNTQVMPEINAEIQLVKFVTDKVKVPAEETTYWCHVYKLPDEYIEKHHVYEYEPYIEESSEGIVHHMELFHCEAPANESIPLYKGSCFEKPKKVEACKRVLAAWAMGAQKFSYPEEAGLPIGGKEFNLFVMLEIHYNNPDKVAGIVDNSGIQLSISRTLREMDAGIMELGLEYTDKMAIPPGQESFPLVGFCTSECTAVGLPQEGITIFASQLHTHLTGIRVYTKHFRNSIELPELNRDNHFSTHFQEITRLKRSVKVLPGDALVTRCDYNTESRNNITLGGFSISDEMCVNYIHYFPATHLEVCKSSISDHALSTFFRYMQEWEGQDTSESKPISENYKAIEWNKMRVQLLSEVYSETPLSMQCNMSNGDRFPGYWENTPQTIVVHNLPPPPRYCENIN